MLWNVLKSLEPSRFCGWQGIVKCQLSLYVLVASIALCGVFSIAQEKQVAESKRMVRRVDELLQDRLKEIGWSAAGHCDDAAFLRRASLDLTGAPPTAGEVVVFLEDKSADKRQRLVDRLLESPSSASHFARIWASWMLPEENNLFVPQGELGLQNWLRNRFAENLRYDRLVSDLMVSSGSAQSGPTAFFLALEGKPEKIAAKTSRVFLGLQLDCAQCHDHPFDSWSQTDFWGFAAYFAQISAGSEEGMPNTMDVSDTDTGEVTLPDTEQIIAPNPLVATGQSGLASGTRRQQLSLWLTARENPFVARAAVNRVWSLLFGRGLIEPIDDMRSLEMASHPQLLKELSEYFASSGYDLRNLIALLAKTEAYQRATIHRIGNPPEASYATMAVKPLTEAQLTASLTAVARQISDGDAAANSASLQSQLGKLRADGSQANLGIVSALVALHGNQFDQVSREDSSRLLKALQAPYMDPAKQLRWLFLSTLSREPTVEEKQAFSELLSAPVGSGPSKDATAETENAFSSPSVWQSDLLWALINSTEFAMTP